MKAGVTAIALLAATAAVVPVATVAKEQRRMTVTDSNRAIVIDFARLFYTERNVKAAFDRYVAPGYIQHNPGLPDGPDAAIAMLTKLFGGPGATFEIKRILVDGDMAAIHLHGRPDPAGKGVAVVDLYRLENGKIVEHWDVVQPVPETAANPHPMF